MQRYVLISLFLLYVRLAAAETFELQDPAADIYAEQNEPEQALAAEPEPLSGQPATQATSSLTPPAMRCTLDIENGYCRCNDKVSGHRLEMSPDACRTRIRQSLDSIDQG